MFPKSILPLLLLLLFILSIVEAKRSRGSIALNSERTEFTIGKFSFSSHIDGTISGDITFPGAEALSYFRTRNHNLIISIFDDSSWANYQKMAKKGSLCKERILKAKNYPISLKSGSTVVHFEHKIHQSPTVLNSFAVISDCALEDYPANPPRIGYDVNFLNGTNHLPQDEIHLPLLLGVILIPVFVCLGYILYTLRSNLKQTSQLHLIQLLILATFGAVALSLISQLCHLHVYSNDGLGLKLRHTWFAMDFLSELAQLISDICITFIFLSISLFGWMFSTQSSKITSVLQFKHLPLGLGYAVLQVLLQSQGRRYEEDFNYFFYDITHLPGFIMMVIRLGCLVLFLIGLSINSGAISIVVKKIPSLAKFLESAGFLSKSQSQRVSNDENVGWLSGEAQNSQINRVFFHLSIVGCLWFISLPLSQFVVQFLFNPSIRRLVILIISLGTHCATIFFLCYAFLSKNSLYFQHSSLLHLGNSVFGATSHIASNKIAID